MKIWTGQLLGDWHTSVGHLHENTEKPLALFNSPFPSSLDPKEWNSSPSNDHENAGCSDCILERCGIVTDPVTTVSPLDIFWSRLQPSMCCVRELAEQRTGSHCTSDVAECEWQVFCSTVHELSLRWASGGVTALGAFVLLLQLFEQFLHTYCRQLWRWVFHNSFLHCTQKREGTAGLLSSSSFLTYTIYFWSTLDQAHMYSLGEPSSLDNSGTVASESDNSFNRWLTRFSHL